MRALQSHQRYASLPWLIATMTVVALAIGTIAARYVESRLVASKGESLALAAAEIAHKLDLLLAEQYDDVVELSRTQEAFRKGGVESQSSYLRTVKTIHPIYLWIGATDADGRIMAATDRAFIGMDMSRSPWFQAVRDTRQVHVGDVEPFAEAGGIDAISFTAPLTGPRGEFRGTVTTRMGLPLLEDVVARTLRAFQMRQEFGGTFEYKFLTATGDVFIDSDLFRKGSVNLKRMKLPSALLSESGQPGYVEEEHLQRHVRVITGYALTQGAGDFAGLKWTVLLRTDRDDLVAPIRSMLWKLSAAWVLIWLPMLAFVLWSTSRLKKEQAHAEAEHVHAVTAEKNYRLLVEQARDIIYRADVEGRFIFVNQTASHMMGYSEQELLGLRFVELIRPDAREAAVRFYGRQVVRKTPSTYYEFPALTKDGREIWFGQNVQVLLENGQVVGIHAMARDITDRKRAEEALRESELQMRLFMEATADCIWNWDLAANCVTRNAGFQRLFGYADEEIVPTIDWWAERLHPDDRERVWAIYGDAVASGRTTCSYEYRFRRRDGSYAIVCDHGFIVRDDTGKVVRALGAMTDITERKRAEVAVHLAKEFSEGIIHSSLDGILAFDHQCRYTVWNPGMERISGVSKEQTLGKCAFDVFPFLKEIGEDKYFIETLAGKTVVASDRPYVVPETGRQGFFEGHYSPLYGKSGEIVGGLAIIRDITERKRTEGERKALSLRNEALVKALGQIVYDWRPLTSELIWEGNYTEVLGYSKLEMGTTTDSWTSRVHPDDLENVLNEVKRATRERRNFDLEYRFLHRNGSYLWMHDRGVLSVTPKGELERIIGVFFDITERKRAEQDQRQLLMELAESRNRFEMFFRETPSAIAITTVKEGRFLDVNKQAEILTGYSREELIGRTTLEMNLYVDPADRVDLVQRLNERGVITDLERQIRTKSGEIRTAIFSLVSIQMGSEPCILSIAYDITERKRAEQELRERSRQQATEAELSLLAVTVQSLPNLLSTTAELVLNALEVDYCEVLELLPNGTDLRLCASAGWRGDRIGQVKKASSGSLAHAALQSSKPVIMQDLRTDAHSSGPRWLIEHEIVSGVGVTIHGKEDPWGVLDAYAAGTRSFSRDDINFLQTISSILATAIERVQAEDVLRNANRALQTLSRQLLRVQEDDRRAIARDLHDEIGQSLTAIKLNVERARRTSDRAARDAIMKDCLQITEEVLNQVRNLSLDLHPSILDDLGLAYALKWYADRQGERAGLKIEVAVDPSLPRLPHDVEIACFRIAQEALTNVVRHAKARRADVTLKQEPTRVELHVQDDGTGFVVHGASPLDGEASVGLASMQERVRLLGGELRINSKLGYGTEVIALLPLSLTPLENTLADKASQT